MIINHRYATTLLDILLKEYLNTMTDFDNLDQALDALMTKLTGQTNLNIVPSSTDNVKNKYQLPLKHTKGSAEINEKNKPWIIGTYSSIPFLRSIDQTIRPHWGVDLAAPKGSPIYSIGPGVVRETGISPKSGNFVTILHENGNVSSYYAHLNKINVTAGEEVDFNTIIGEVGDSGNAKGTQPHLHYEVKIDGRRVDPQSIIGKEVGSLFKKAYLIKRLITKYSFFRS